jgi:hypothetical protein
MLGFLDRENATKKSHHSVVPENTERKREGAWGSFYSSTKTRSRATKEHRANDQGPFEKGFCIATII